jgi:thioredoxin-dependent peroxiredoxin
VTLAPGDAAPPFALPDQTGATVRLEDFRGRMLLVYFYPKADTPGCTTQSCAVRDAREDLRELGADVVGISPDRPEAQAAFDEKFGLGFPLLADPDHAVAEAWGTWGERSMYGNTFMGIIRSSFLVGPDGKIVEAWYKVSPKDTVPKARSALAANG